ncbi:MAG: hypothetical protein ABGX83_05245 [Nitrospira sp.]
MTHEITKLPYEVFPLLVSFVHDLDPDESVLGAPVVTCVNHKSGVDSKAQIIQSEAPAGKTDVKVVIKGGVLDEIHKVTVQLTTDITNVYEKDVFVLVQAKRRVGEDLIFKQVSEEFVISNDFAEDFESGDFNISHSVVATALKDGTDKTSTIISGSAIIGSKILMGLANGVGVNGEYYELSFRSATTFGYKYERLVNMMLKDI